MLVLSIMSSTVALVACFAAFLAMCSASTSQRRLVEMAAEQHDALMAFHAAGRSLAAHEIEQLRITMAIKQAEAEKAGLDLRLREIDRTPAPQPHASKDRGRFGSNGVVVGPQDLDGT